jgi:hypothetical protein
MTCQAAAPRLGPVVDDVITIEWQECGAPAAGQVTGGCVHEHVRTIDVCFPHELSLTTAPIGCIACFEDGHECQMVVRRTSKELPLPDGHERAVARDADYQAFRL